MRTRTQRHWNRSSSLVFVAAIGAAAAAVLPATRASAEIRIGEREGWVLTTDGRINNFLSVTRGNWIPAGEPPYTGVDDAQTTGNQIMATHTGQDMKTVERDTERDNFFGAHEAVKYGLVDKVLVSRAAAAA